MMKIFEGRNEVFSQYGNTDSLFYLCEIFETALNTVGAEPSDVVFVGDSYRADYLGAERAGMRAYLIDPWRWEPVPDDRRLRSVFDLPARLAGIIDTV